MVPVTDRDTTEQVAAEEVRLSPRARMVRLVVASAILALTLVGTVVSSDEAFPFGPPRMYATRADPDAPVSSTRVVGLTEDGTEVPLSGGEVGLRRAEFEGQVPRLVDNPELLGLLATTFAANHPQAPPLRAVAIIVRRYELDDGVRTGSYVDVVLVTHPVGADAEGGE